MAGMLPRPRPRKRAQSVPPQSWHTSYEEAVYDGGPVPTPNVRQHRVFDDSIKHRDKPGAELAREASIWSVYVGEADKWDTEKVQGWNDSLDVLLVFAGLFSAILTAFLIEASNMLKQDPNDVSAAALIAISQVLMTMTTNSVSNLTASIPDPSIGMFVPSKNAVIVNTLWFLSLGLSLATAFIAMLAKDWCHSFHAGRNGHPRDQAFRRQRKWKMIERWKMEEVILALPSLIHLSLMLFSIGLCIYLLDLNITAAIPVICVSGAAMIFYISSSLLASIVNYFPYTTVAGTVLCSRFMIRVYRYTTTLTMFTTFLPLFLALIAFSVGLGLITAPVAIIISASVTFIHIRGIRPEIFSSSGAAGDTITSFYLEFPELAVHYVIAVPIIHPLRSIFSPILRWIDGLRLTDDLTTSLALSWILKYCETPSAVDKALQALSGASQRIPKQPLISSGATSKILRRMVSDNTASDKSLYTRGLKFLEPSTTTVARDNIGREDVRVLVWGVKSENESQITKLLEMKQFIPDQPNLTAMELSNVASPKVLQSLGGRDVESIADLRSITDLLCRHLESKIELHPASVQALANAAALHVSVLKHPSIPKCLAGLCMRLCTLLRPEPEEVVFARFQDTHATATILALCVLSSSERVGENQLGAETPLMRVARCKRSVKMILDVYIQDQHYRDMLCWIIWLEILSHPRQYGLRSDDDRFTSLQRWCVQRACFTIRLSHNLVWHPEPGMPNIPLKGSIKDRNLDILSRINQIYELIEPSAPDGLKPAHHLPGPVYVLVAKIALLASSDEEWNTSTQLLAKSGFPHLDTGLYSALTSGRCMRSRRFILKLGDVFYGRRSEHRKRAFAAIQLWVLLLLTNNLSSLNNTRSSNLLDLSRPMLAKIVTNPLRRNTLPTPIPLANYPWELQRCLDVDGGLQISTKGWARVKTELEEHIIGWCLTERSLDIYTSWVLECIYYSRGEQPPSAVANQLQANLEQVPQCLRGISALPLTLAPLFVPLPPSRPPSINSAPPLDQDQHRPTSTISPQEIVPNTNGTSQLALGQPITQIVVHTALT